MAQLPIDREGISEQVTGDLRSALNFFTDTYEIQEAYAAGLTDAELRDETHAGIEVSTLQMFRQLGYIAAQIEKRSK